MIDYLIGTIKDIKEKSVTILVNGVGFQLQTPNIKNIIKDKEAQFYTYLHWNQERGPSLFGFQNELEKTVFLLIIDCPKIGPGIATSILSQMSPEQFIEAINTKNQDILSSINGIGEKKAEQLIVQLKHKVAKLITSGKINTQVQQDFIHWQNINDVLISLNYSKPEINKALQYLSEKYSGQNIQFDQLIRSALSFLSGNI